MKEGCFITVDMVRWGNWKKYMHNYSQFVHKYVTLL